MKVLERFVCLLCVCGYIVADTDGEQRSLAKDRRKTLSNSFVTENLNCHNRYRRLHGVNHLSMTSQLNQVAQAYADKLSKNDGGLIHSKGELGENLYASIGFPIHGNVSCDSWYNEIKLYDFHQIQPPNLHAVGHFTQMVWRGTCFVGFGVSTARSGWTYVVANYDPPGNVQNEFTKNVFLAGHKPDNRKKTRFDALINDDVLVCVDSDREAFRKQNLYCHNVIREKHGSVPLIYSSQLNDEAQKMAENLAKHAGGALTITSPYGYNLFSTTGGKEHGFMACKQWYKGSTNYNYKLDNPSNSLSFTQLVWKSSHKTGVGVARASSGKIYVVSLYDPPGNYAGRFKANVFPPVYATSKIDYDNTTVSADTTTESGDITTESGDTSTESGDTSTESGDISTESGDASTEATLTLKETMRREIFKRQNLECHNELRKIHGVHPLTYSKELNEFAQNMSDVLAYGGSTKKLRDSHYGFNVLYTNDQNVNGYSACKHWYKGHSNYNYKNPPTVGNRDFLSFTQLVWKSTKRIGIGESTSGSGTTFIVAVYDPRGNVRSHYDNNVPLPHH